MTGTRRLFQPFTGFLIAAFLLTAAGCGSGDETADARPELQAAKEQPEAATRPPTRDFPTGVTEIQLPFTAQQPAAEIALDYSDEVIPQAGDEAVLETESAAAVTEVGRARVIRVTADQIMLRLTSKPVQPATRIRILANAIHRCDLLAASPLDTHAVISGVEYEEIDVTAIGVCGQAVGKYPMAARFHFQLGRAMDAHQQEQAAIANYRRALALDPEYAAALLALGGKYLNGEGVARDTEEGLRLLQQAYELGLPRAAYSLASVHDRQTPGITADRRLAVAYYTSAALEGDLPAQLRLAQMYERGEGVEQDLARALDWHELAARQGHADSQLRLGQAYAQGRGREQEWGKAWQWLDRAANQGEAGAQVSLGEMFEAGQGLEAADMGKAMYWYRQAAEQGSAMGQYHLGRIYALGLGVDKDKEQARKWLLLAQAQGVQAAARLLQPERPPRVVAADTAPRQPPRAERRVTLKRAKRWRVKTQGYMDRECYRELMDELDDLDIRVVGDGGNPEVTLIVTMNDPEYYSRSFGPLRFSGYNIQFRAEVIRNSDNVRLFYTYGDEKGDDRTESCVDTVDEIIDDLEDFID